MLLDFGLETLHEQSIEWLSDIAFWRDEVAFLYALEVKGTLKETPMNAKSRLDKIESELEQFTGGEIDSLYNEVMAHERFLDNLLSSKREDEVGYREKHLQISEKIDSFNLRFKILKREIFDIVKESNGIPKLKNSIS